MTVISKNNIHSAIYLIICFFTLSVHYLLFNAQFLAVVHLIVYSGAIMVLFIFTIMLMNLNEEAEPHKSTLSKIAAAISFCIVLTVFLAVLKKAHPEISYSRETSDYQSLRVLGKVLMNEYLVPFQFASILLLVSMVGAVLVSKKDKKSQA